MTKKDTVYLYAGDNSPRVKLSCIRQSLSFTELTDFFINLQNRFYLEFECNETITENLKIQYSSTITDSCNNNSNSMGIVPFYVVEYDEIIDSFCVWKSNGEWDLNKIVTSLYNTHQSNNNNSFVWKKYFLRDRRFRYHPLKKVMSLSLNHLKNIDWSQINLDRFWTNFNKIYEDHKTTDGGIDNQFMVKSFISMSVLKTNVMENQSKLINTFEMYYNKMKPTVKEITPLSQLNTNQIDSTIFDSDCKSPRSSARSSVSSASPLTDLNDSRKVPTYTYNNRSVSDKNAHLNNTHHYSNNEQLYSNFKDHFKDIVEDYEMFELRTKQKRKNKKTINKIAKPSHA